MWVKTMRCEMLRVTTWIPCVFGKHFSDNFSGKRTSGEMGRFSRSCVHILILPIPTAYENYK